MFVPLALQAYLRRRDSERGTGQVSVTVVTDVFIDCSCYASKGHGFPIGMAIGSGAPAPTRRRAAAFSSADRPQHVTLHVRGQAVSRQFLHALPHLAFDHLQASRCIA